MLNIDWEENRLKILIFITFVLAIVVYFSLQKDEEEYKIIKAVQPQIEKSKEMIIEKPIEIKKEKKIKPKVKKIEPIENEIIEEENISLPQEIKEELIELYRSSDNSGRYTIKLLSNKTIEEKKRDFTRYIIISGEIENNNEINEFPMSLNENYTDFIDDIFITIDDIARDDNKTLKCDGYFLSGLDINTMYQIKIDIVDDSTSCYIKSQQELPAFVKELGNSVKPVIAETQEETSIMDNKTQEKTSDPSNFQD
jgi:hypothetical protein